MRFSLVIPCYNEAKNLPLLFERCIKVCEDKDFEVIIVDNGSTDDTQNVLSRLLPSCVQCKSIRVPVNQGYGFGIVSGLNACTGDIIGWTHADLQTDPVDVLRTKEIFLQNGENIFVKGKRYGRPLGDRVFTFGMSIFETILLKRKLWDINAQPTMFSRKFYNTKWKNPPSDFSLDLYAYYLALSNNLEVYRFQVKFGERAYGVSHWNINWKAKYKFIKRTIDFSLKLKRKVI